MKDLMKIAKEACTELAKKPGVLKVILFGKVSKNIADSNSDIDLAAIIDSILRGPYIAFEGFIAEQTKDLNKITERIEKKYGVKRDLCLFWDEEYDRGIMLKSGKYPGYDLLKKTGIILYDQEKENTIKWD